MPMDAMLVVFDEIRLSWQFTACSVVYESRFFLRRLILPVTEQSRCFRCELQFESHALCRTIIFIVLNHVASRFTGQFDMKIWTWPLLVRVGVPEIEQPKIPDNLKEFLTCIKTYNFKTIREALKSPQPRGRIASVAGSQFRKWNLFTSERSEVERIWNLKHLVLVCLVKFQSC